MKTCIKEYQDSVKRLEANAELTEKLEAKMSELEDESRTLAGKKIAAKDDWQSALRQNVQGLMSQTELDVYQAKVSKIERNFSEAKQKQTVAITILDENRAEATDLEKQCSVAHFRFKRASYRDCLSKITDSDRDKVYNIIAMARHLPGLGYEKALREAFPQEPIEKNKLRWKAFVDKYQLPD